jgi:hypothetical protein
MVGPPSSEVARPGGDALPGLFAVYRRESASHFKYLKSTRTVALKVTCF